MNCYRFENIVCELTRGGIMEAELQAEALLHSGECETCAFRLRDEESLTAGLRALASEMEAVRAPDQVEQHLRAAFRRREVVPLVAPSARRDYRRYWIAAAAAVLLIFASIVAVRWHTVNVPSQEVGKKTEAPASVTIANGPSNSPFKKDEKGFDSPRRRKPNNNFRTRSQSLSQPVDTLASNRPPAEIATEFMPLGYMNAASLQDGGQIVRVELPRSALANFGFPVNMDRYNEKVKADVVLGVDGLAHAIRFVQ
jgi:hypothetical protein